MTGDEDVDYTLPPWGPWGRDVTLGVVSGGSKFLLQVLNRLDLKGGDLVQRYILNKEQDRPLFTVCNHIRYAF